MEAVPTFVNASGAQHASSSHLSTSSSTVSRPATNQGNRNAEAHGSNDSKNGSNLADIQTKKPTSSKNARKIVTEDMEWNLAPVKTLRELAIDVIVKSFKDHANIDNLPFKYRGKILQLISTELPISVIGPLIPDDGVAEENSSSIGGSIFWKRCCQQRFPPAMCNPLEHGGSWKSLYFELHVQELIENFTPGVDDMKKLLEDLKIAKDYVRFLRIKQLKPSGWEGPDLMYGATIGAQRVLNPTKAPPLSSIRPSTKSERQPAPKEPLLDISKVILTDGSQHIDLVPIFTTLTNLKEIHLTYGVRDCAMRFTWSLFGMSPADMKFLTTGIKASSTLTLLSLQASGVTDDLCKLLCASLKSCRTLKHLDLSHNKIKDFGARALATLLGHLPSPEASEPEASPPLISLNLSNNKIGASGAVALGKSLAHNTSLASLNLRLNLGIGDEGAANMIAAFSFDNVTLHSLSLSSCHVGEQTCVTLSEALNHYAELNTKMRNYQHALESGVEADDSMSRVSLNSSKVDEEDMEDDKKNKVKKKPNQAKNGPPSTPAMAKKKPKQPISRRPSKIKKAAAASPLERPESRTTSLTVHDESNDAVAVPTTNDPRVIYQRICGQYFLLHPEEKKENVSFMPSHHAFIAGLSEMDLSANASISGETCGKALSDAVRLNKCVTKMDVRGTDIDETYAKMILTSSANNQDFLEAKKRATQS